MTFSYSLFLVLLLIWPGLCFWAGYRLGERNDLLSPSPDKPNSTINLFMIVLGTFVGHLIGTIALAVQAGWCRVTSACFSVPYDPNMYRALLNGSRYDGSHDARANNMPIAYARTRISNLHPTMAPVINTVAAAARELGIDPRAVTSGTDGVHRDGSQHYDRKGLDFRGKDIPIATGRALANEVRSRLGSDYYVAFETFPDNPSNNHLHVSRRRGR